MGQPLDLGKMSIDELWDLYQQTREVLATKIKTEKQELDRRLGSLHPTSTRAQTRRPYPPVLPKFANPDAPDEVWSGRGRKPRWVADKLSAGLALKDLSIVPPQSAHCRDPEFNRLNKTSSPARRH
jgi:DNA-binding protein H-NS